MCAARSRWGRAASRCLVPRQISGRRVACPPARRPRRELRSARRLEARPGPAGPAAASNRSGLVVCALPGQAPPPTGAVARARPPARLGPHFVRRRASKPARALRTLRRPPHQWGWVAVVWFGALFWRLSGPRRCPRVSHLGPVDQTARLSETAVACARECLRGLETAIAFAGENWVFLARFSVALVLSVSMGVVQGRALVMVVSRWPVSVVVEVSLVSPSPPHCVLCAKKFALRALVVGVSAKKFALRAQNGPKSAFYGVLGEVFRGSGREGMLLGELCRACESATACRPHGQALRRLQHTPHR